MAWYNSLLASSINYLLVQFEDSSYVIGFLQLAGGTNIHTVEGLKKERLFQTTTIHGINSTVHTLLSSHSI